MKHKSVNDLYYNEQQEKFIQDITHKSQHVENEINKILDILCEYDIMENEFDKLEDIKYELINKFDKLIENM